MGRKHGARQRVQVLPRFNNGEALVAVLVADDPPQIGIIDSANLGVWTENSMLESIRIPGLRTLPRIELPHFPPEYGRWEVKAAGGVSRTARRVDIIRAASNLAESAVLFSLSADASTHDAVLSALRDALDSEMISMHEPEFDDDSGWIDEIVVYNAARDFGYVAALIARSGASVLPEDPGVNAERPAGIERFDRIPCSTTVSDDQVQANKQEHEYGMHRGDDNWRFSWIPKTWTHVPLTWDYMVYNVSNVSDVRSIPQPLRQHVVLRRLLDVDDPEERFSLQRHAPEKRFVAAGLTVPQSKQLAELFFTYEVERWRDSEDAVCAMRLAMAIYALHTGSIGRWIGTYNQKARHVGNGKELRRFTHLPQYEPHRLSSKTINALAGRDGRLRGKGSKGSRSRYASLEKRYVPRRTAPRSQESEGRMRVGGSELR